jgi:hypothetical protein
MAKEVLEMEVKSNIGELSKDTQAIIEAIKGAKKETKELSKETEGVGKSSAKSVSGVKKLTGAFGGLMKSLGIVAIVASVFTALKEALERNQKAMDLMETVMSTISTTFNQIVIVLSDVVKWVTESSDRFDGLGKVLSGIVTLSLTPLKLSFYALKLGVQEVMLAWEDSFLGGGDKGKIAELREEIKLTKTNLEEVAIAAVDAGKDVVNNIGDAIGEIGAIYEKAAEGVSKISVKANYEQAKATTAATKAAKFAAAEFAKLNAEKLKEAELFRQIRDDETKTFAERIQANKDLKKSLEEQQKLQSDQIQKQVTAAALAVQQNGNDENKLALMEAQNAQLELEETITGQLSEQKTNQVSLEKELAETRNEVLLAGLDGLALEIAELETAYELKKEMARKSGMDITEITEKYEKEKGDIIESYQKKVVKWSEMSSEQQLGIASSAAGDMAKILGEQTEAGRAMAVVQTTIDTFTSAQAAYKSLAGIPYVGPVLGGIAAAAAVAMGMKNIQAIKGANSSGGAGGGGSVSAPSTPAPQMMSGAFDISGGVAPEATKAYVVTDEMSNSQNQLANIRRRATI